MTDQAWASSGTDIPRIGLDPDAAVIRPLTEPTPLPAPTGVVPVATVGPRGPVDAQADPDRSEPSAATVEAMRDLYDRCHVDMVRFAAFLTGSVHAAEDIAHEAFAKVFDAWDRLDDTTRVEPYLKTTVVNLVRGRHRRTQTAVRNPEPHLIALASAEDEAIGQINRERVLDAVAALPLRQRACVVMRHWMRMTETEIAESLDLSVGSVRTHVKRGTKSLRARLGEGS